MTGFFSSLKGLSAHVLRALVIANARSCRYVESLMARLGGGGTLRSKEEVIPVTTYAPDQHAHRPHVTVWVAVGAVLVLVAAVGGGVLIGRSTKSAEPSQGLASEKVVTTIDGSLAALNRGDLDAFAAYWTRYAVLEDASLAAVARGRREIVDLNEGFFSLGARYYRRSAVIQRGNLAAYVVSCPPCPGAWSGIDLVQFDESWKIDHLWTGRTAEPTPSP